MYHQALLVLQNLPKIFKKYTSLNGRCSVFLRVWEELHDNQTAAVLKDSNQVSE